ncbi:MAG: hypothetical protein IK115_06060 [Lachnospiraceae bacterium]|nr:hypothetical protein [Lachnospiraceae bacterium]
MNGFYSLWTAPSAAEAGKGFAMADHDLVCLLLSVACWERYNGKSRLYADEAATKYFLERDLDRIFSRGLEALSVPKGIDPKVFWAAGKLCALSMEDLPSAMIDTDLIVWQGIGKQLKGTSLAVIHREELNPEIYPDPGLFRMAKGYHFPKSWDFNIRPANTALLFMRDEVLRDAYVSESLRFMQNCEEHEDMLCPMVFAEQRILPMVAGSLGINTFAFCERIEHLREQKMFTHLWGHKNVFKYNRDEQKAFVRRCMLRMRRDFPEMYERAAALAELREYTC